MTTPTRICLEAAMHLTVRKETLFPLLCPVREYEWIETWQCTMVHSNSGVAEEGCVFQTILPPVGVVAAHPEAAIDTWVICGYCPSQHITFTRNNGHRTILYTITLTDTKDGTSLVWSQQLTALTETGRAMLAETTQEQFATLIKALERMLNHYCTTGQRLAQHDVERFLTRSTPQ